MKYLRIILIVLFLIGLADAFYLGRVTTKPQILALETQLATEKVTNEQLWQMSLEYQRAVESRDAVIEWYKAQPPQLKETKVYQDKIVYQNVPTPIKIKEFQSLDEFFENMSNYTYFTGGCLSIAENLQRALMTLGYSVSIAIAWNGYYDDIKVCPENGAIFYVHAGLLVNIQGVYYFYDPESKQMTRLF